MGKPERPSPKYCLAHILCWDGELSATLLIGELGTWDAEKRTFSAICGCYLEASSNQGCGKWFVVTKSEF